MQPSCCRVHHYPQGLHNLFKCTQGKRVAVSGSGNVAVYTVEKLLELGAVPLTVSDSTGYVYYAEGMTKEDLDAVNEHKVVQHGRLTDFKTGARAPLSACCACAFRTCCSLVAPCSQVAMHSRLAGAHRCPALGMGFLSAAWQHAPALSRCVCVGFLG